MKRLIFTFLMLAVLNAGANAQTVKKQKFPGMGWGAVLDYRQVDGETGNVILIAPTDMFYLSWYDAVGQSAPDELPLKSSGAATYLAPGEIDSQRGSWRMPTRKELVMMWRMSDEIEKIYGKKNGFHYTDYWSSEEYDPTYGWYVNFMNGRPYYIEKIARGRVRCVKTLSE